MTIRVELFGVPRLEAGVDQVAVLPARGWATLAEVLQAVAAQVPAFGATCLDSDGLRAGVLANINGDRFERDLGAIISEEQTLLILSADAGG